MTLSEPAVDRIVDAIYRVEGGAKTRYPYGIIKLGPGADVVRARELCRQTVVNNYRRWVKAGSKGNFLDFLADRYCPPSVDSKGNANWKKNIHKFLK